MRPFEISVPETVLQDLRSRLAATRWPEPLPGGGWRRGADLGYLRALCDYWRSGYDWRAAEARLNQFPQFLAEVDGVDIHYWHVRAKGPSALPLLLIHGWPGSIFELIALIGPLTDPAAHGRDGPAFDVVVPSIPGFGFSGKPRETGWGISRMGAAFDTLMRDVLGYHRYGIHGGDAGTTIGARMAGERPGPVAGLHINMRYAFPPTPDDTDPHHSDFWANGMGYFALQSTRPDSIAVATADSPAGLAGWVLDKFAAWSGAKGDLSSCLSMDDLLTNLMFYWVTNSAASAARIYVEMVEEGVVPFGSPPVTVPVAVAAFPDDPFRAPRPWLEPIYNIVRWTDFERGGHFPGLERPAELAADVAAFFAEVAAGRWPSRVS